MCISFKTRDCTERILMNRNYQTQIIYALNNISKHQPLPFGRQTIITIREVSYNLCLSCLYGLAWIISVEKPWAPELQSRLRRIARIIELLYSLTSIQYALWILASLWDTPKYKFVLVEEWEEKKNCTRENMHFISWHPLKIYCVTYKLYWLVYR